MIKREKLNKHNWKHTYYYYLPKSVHTAEPEASTATRTTQTISAEAVGSKCLLHINKKQSIIRKSIKAGC
jgi:hypothetical protein